jgi:hypothetical protein
VEVGAGEELRMFPQGRFGDWTMGSEHASKRACRLWRTEA